LASTYPRKRSNYTCGPPLNQAQVDKPRHVTMLTSAVGFDPTAVGRLTPTALIPLHQVSE